mmetsp:Transcript_23906/g.33206  ORF Transcript_23906/g.33206 Transcript_23906/m.33206 type:complete len:516 (-) Transcript_23906:40-1587(-)
MGNACVSNVIDCLVFTPPDPCSYDQEMKEAKETGTLPEGIVFVETKHGSRIPVHIVKHRRARCTVLYSHGNSEDLGPMISNQYLSEWFRGNYVSYDYTGYGYSEGGQHTEEHVYNDIEAVYKYLITEAGISPDEIILYGRSLGSGPTVHLASTKPKGIAGMVLESALLSIVRTQCRCVSNTWKADIFANIDKIEKIEAPSLIIHGTRDCVVPHYHGQYLQSHIKNTVEPLWLPRGHNDLWDGDEQHCRPIFDRINKFIIGAIRQRRKERLLKTVHPNKIPELDTKRPDADASQEKLMEKERTPIGPDDIQLLPMKSSGNISLPQKIVSQQPESANLAEKDTANGDKGAPTPKQSTSSGEGESSGTNLDERKTLLSAEKKQNVQETKKCDRRVDAKAGESERTDPPTDSHVNKSISSNDMLKVSVPALTPGQVAPSRASLPMIGNKDLAGSEQSNRSSVENAGHDSSGRPRSTPQNEIADAANSLGGMSEEVHSKEQANNAHPSRKKPVGENSLSL